jgi:hypothetical protein
MPVLHSGDAGRAHGGHGAQRTDAVPRAAATEAAVSVTLPDLAAGATAKPIVRPGCANPRQAWSKEGGNPSSYE